MYTTTIEYLKDSNTLEVFAHPEWSSEDDSVEGYCLNSKFKFSNTLTNEKITLHQD